MSLKQGIPDNYRVETEGGVGPIGRVLVVPAPGVALCGVTDCGDVIALRFPKA